MSEFTEKDALIVIEPAFRLEDFTLDAGYYKKATPRRPSQIKRSGVLMEGVGSLGEVNTNNKFYYDGSNIWFDHNPIGFYIVVFFQLFYGSRGYKLPRGVTSGTEVVYYEPRIQGNPSFSKTGKDRIEGISVNGEASFRLLDTNDDIFDSLADMTEEYSFVNKRVDIYRYVDEKDIKKVFKGTITDWEMDRVSVKFTAKDDVRRLDNSVSKDEYDLTQFPICDPNFLGKAIRVVYGECMVGCVNIDFVDGGGTSDNRVWRVSSHANFSIKEVWLRDTKLTVTSHYSLNVDKNEITLINNLEASFGWDTVNAGDVVFALAEGKMAGAALIDNASDIVKDLLIAAGFETNELNLPSFIQAKADNTYKIGLALPKQRQDERSNAREAIEEINRSAIGYLTSDENFLMKYNIYKPLLSIKEIDINRDMIGRTRRADATEIFGTLTADYAYSERFEKYLTASKENEDSKYLHLSEASHSIQTALSSLTDASDVLDRYAEFYTKEFRTEEFSLKLQLADARLGEFIEVDGNLLELMGLNRTITGESITARRV